MLAREVWKDHGYEIYNVSFSPLEIGGSQPSLLSRILGTLASVFH